MAAQQFFEQTLPAPLAEQKGTQFLQRKLEVFIAGGRLYLRVGSGIARGDMGRRMAVDLAPGHARALAKALAEASDSISTEAGA